MSLESKNYKTGTNETVLQKFYILHETNHHFKEKNNRSCLLHVYILHSFRVLPGRDTHSGFGYKRHICLERVSIM